MLAELAMKIASVTHHILPEHRREWADAMIAETQRLIGHRAVWFALGCLAAAVWQRQCDVRFEPVMRWCLALGAGIWATIKLIIPLLLIRGESPVSQHIAIELLLAALCYGMIAFGLIARHTRLWMLGLMGAFAVNSVPTLLTIGRLVPASRLHLALSAEEALVWGMLVIAMIGWLKWQRINPALS